MSEVTRLEWVSEWMSDWSEWVNAWEWSEWMGEVTGVSDRMSEWVEREQEECHCKKFYQEGFQFLQASKTFLIFRYQKQYSKKRIWYRIQMQVDTDSLKPRLLITELERLYRSWNTTTISNYEFKMLDNIKQFKIK